MKYRCEFVSFFADAPSPELHIHRSANKLAVPSSDMGYPIRDAAYTHRDIHDWKNLYACLYRCCLRQ